jgi:predicted anti-sigma-YlaC factor YlaD
MTEERGLRVSCQQVVELVTDYLEGRLDAERCLDVEAHLKLCPPCRVYIDQMRQTIGMLGHVPLETLSDEAKATLMSAFRGESDSS